MENVNETFLRELAYLNQGNEKIIDLVRRVYRSLMELRKELAKYESI